MPALISLDWARNPCDRAPAPHLFWQCLQPPPQLGKHCKEDAREAPPPCRSTVRSRYAPPKSPPNSARLDVAHRGRRANTTPLTRSEQQAAQSSTVLLGQWARKKWRMSSPGHPLGEAALARRGTRPPMGFVNVASRALFFRSNRRGHATDTVGGLAMAEWRGRGSPVLIATLRNWWTRPGLLSRPNQVVFFRLPGAARGPSGTAGVELPRRWAGGRESAAG